MYQLKRGDPEALVAQPLRSCKKTTHFLQLSVLSPKSLRLQKNLVQNASSFPYGEYACGTKPAVNIYLSGDLHEQKTDRSGHRQRHFRTGHGRHRQR
jgi:hypothetical protein